MIAQNVAEIVSRHVKLTLEAIDRMYLNVFVPGLQYENPWRRWKSLRRGRGLRLCNFTRGSAKTR